MAKVLKILIELKTTEWKSGKVCSTLGAPTVHKSLAGVETTGLEELASSEDWDATAASSELPTLLGVERAGVADGEEEAGSGSALFVIERDGLCGGPIYFFSLTPRGNEGSLSLFQTSQSLFLSKNVSHHPRGGGFGHSEIQEK